MWWGKEREVIKILKCALKALSCSHKDSDSGLEGLFGLLWSPFQGAPSTTIWDAPTSKDSQGWAAHSSERELIHGWVNLSTRQSCSPGTCLPYFLSSASNLTRVWLDEMPWEEATVSCSQNHPQAKAKPAFPEILISAATRMSLMRALFIPLANLRAELDQVRVSFHKGNYPQTWKIWGIK